MNSLRLLAAQMDFALGKRRHSTPPTSPLTNAIDDKARRGERAGEGFVESRDGRGSKWNASGRDSTARPDGMDEAVETATETTIEKATETATETAVDISSSSESETTPQPESVSVGASTSTQPPPPTTTTTTNKWRLGTGLYRVVFSAIVNAFFFLLPIHRDSALFRLFSLVRFPSSRSARRANGRPAVPAGGSATASDGNTSDEGAKSPRPRTKQQRKNRPRGFSIGAGGQLVVAPPRPLLSKKLPMKTLVLDLDETLIHSLSRGSQFSASQMVEVRLENQMATLYFVNKRPYCDHFLRTVAQWFRLVVFTASVQAYADPMIDWLEKERKFFARRLYRQHCRETPAGYVKDLAQVDPDLRNVVILDNSPISYSMQENNAIAIEGWISDPSDHSLLHLLPVLNALRYSHDVRPFLSLRQGEAAFE